MLDKKRDYLENHVLIKKLHEKTEITLDDLLNGVLALNPMCDHVVSVPGYDGELHDFPQRPPEAKYWFIDTTRKQELGERLVSFEKNKRLVMDCVILVWLVTSITDDRFKYTRDEASRYIHTRHEVVRVELNREAGRARKGSRESWKEIFNEWVSRNNVTGERFKAVLRMMETQNVISQEPDGNYLFEGDTNAKSIAEKTIQNHFSTIKNPKSQ
ncbi:hypothetical protein J7904_06610 [Vibrio parahaemolyticus]|nr:hypothetical protein [Vibrio parahaemolyticus]MCF9546947.1 hypothetical protein [Vibrio parahaemolyticus]